jgi:predicted phosphodiesterase
LKQIKVASELFCSDFHIPDIDPKCWKITLTIAHQLQPELIWLGGDYLDFKSVSRFLTNPAERHSAHRAIHAGKVALRELREAAPNARLIFREGNHDRRLQLYIAEKAPELSFLDELRLPNLLQLAAVDCIFAGGDDRTKVGHLWHLHGDELRTGRIYPARAALGQAHDNIIFGHVHRFSVAYEQGLSGTDHVAWSIGCLQNLRVDYSYHAEWTQGVAWIEYTPSGLFQINPIPIFRDGDRKKCLVHSKLYQA